MSRPPLPPFTRETAAQKARMAEDAWNSRDAERVALAYTEDSRWRNRSEVFEGRAAIVAFLTRKWARELDYRLIKDLWAFDGNRIAVRFQYEWHDAAGQSLFLRQRAVGVRQARPDAPPRGQHQRHCDCRKRSPLPLACAGSAARGCAGLERKSILIRYPWHTTPQPCAGRFRPCRARIPPQPLWRCSAVRAAVRNRPSPRAISPVQPAALPWSS